MNFYKYDIYYTPFNINLSKGMLFFLPKQSFWGLTDQHRMMNQELVFLDYWFKMNPNVAVKIIMMVRI